MLLVSGEEQPKKILWSSFRIKHLIYISNIFLLLIRVQTYSYIRSPSSVVKNSSAPTINKHTALQNKKHVPAKNKRHI
jgi:hypothetical protein